MIRIIKKYWVNILLFVLLTLLLFFFIPNQESHYLRPDADIVKRNSRSALLWTEIILCGTLFFFLLKKFKKLSELFVSVFALGTFALGLFFLFDSIFLSAAFLLNKLSTRRPVDKKYTVVYIDKDQKSLLLRDNSSGQIVQANNLLSQDNNNLIPKVNDTLTVLFTKGLLGFNFDAKIKPDRSSRE